jgi:PTH1 family peptidyl-tRNA hydrolase
VWLLVGLGNPGRKYERNRHNVGFFVIDELARRHDLGPFRDRFGGQAADGRLISDKVLLLKPMEYMNHSGFAVQRAAQYYDLAPEQIVVIHDELDLDLARLKLKKSGGAGGHNGLRSIIQQLGSRDFLRVRIGIGKPTRTDGRPAGKEAGASYVLSDFPSAQQAEVEDAVRTAADAVETIVDRGIDRAMNEFNARKESDEAEA